MSKSSPTSRTLADLRELGFVAEIVEKWNQWSKTRHDLFNLFDILAMKPGVGIIGVQATSGSNHAARIAKLRKSDLLPVWLQSGGRAEVWSYAKRGPRGARKVWTLRREEVTE